MKKNPVINSSKFLMATKTLDENDSKDYYFLTFLKRGILLMRLQDYRKASFVFIFLPLGLLALI